MIKACTAWALILGLSATGLRAEEVLEVDLGAPEATATPAPAATAAPTAEPTAVPTVAPTEAATPAPKAAASATPEGTVLDVEPTAAASPGPALDQVRFDNAQAGDEGLMIIAPGAASPEDSLESFGIDSPFNWKGRDRRVLKPGEAAAQAGDEALELSAPESSDLKERVSVETGGGESVPGDSDYDRVERAGIVLNAAEYHVDGRVVRNTGGTFFATRGRQVALKIEPGRQVYPGSIYTVFREAGVQRGHGKDAEDVGMLVRNTGVVKVVRIEGDEVLARVERQYEPILEGDLIRLRDPERLRFYASLRQGGSAPLDLQGEVLGVMPPHIIAQKDDVVFLDLGRTKGAFPGLRLQLVRDAPLADREGVRDVVQTGRLGQVEILNVSRGAASARIIKCSVEVRPGDKVRFR